ncbi:hypothetical protein [Anaerotignum sp.]|uniref:hypothetical protein n=1 Tax=Anaerotignum sp. TaxID=2039241 RepID=UPI0028AF7E9B|nr:hypothetical protein [Anaerotignum sp.]
MTWEIVVGIIALFSFGVAIVKPIVSLTNAITLLNANCEALAKEFSKFDEDNHDSHKRLWDHNKGQDEILREHGQRLHDLDGK